MTFSYNNITDRAKTKNEFCFNLIQLAIQMEISSLFRSGFPTDIVLNIHTTRIGKLESSGEQSGASSHFNEHKGIWKNLKILSI